MLNDSAVTSSQASVFADAPPISRGTPLIILAAMSFSYAVIAVWFSLIPAQGLKNFAGALTGNDFLAYYSGSLKLLAGEAIGVFDQTSFFALQQTISGMTKQFPWAYPPHFLFIVMPLAWLPYLPALYLWIAATSLPLILVMRRFTALPWPLLLVIPPLVQNAINGQNGALTASLLVTGIAALAAGRSWTAGILLGVLSYKPQVFILAPICLLAARDFRALFSLCATVTLLFLASLLFLGIDIWWSFLHNLPQQFAYVLEGRVPADRFPTVFILIFKLTGSALAAQIIQAFSTLAAWSLVYWSWRNSSALLPRILAVCIAMPLSAPYMFEYDLALWAFPAAILWMRLWQRAGTYSDWMAVTLLWLTPPLIWISSLAKINVSVFAILLLVPYVIATVRKEPGSHNGFTRFP